MMFVFPHPPYSLSHANRGRGRAKYQDYCQLQVRKPITAPLLLRRGNKRVRFFMVIPVNQRKVVQHLARAVCKLLAD